MQITRNIIRAALAAMILAMSGCGGGRMSDILRVDDIPEIQREPDMICNGHAELCARKYNETVYAGTHNSMSNAEESWSFPNQGYGIARQLDDGIRALYIDLYKYENEVYMCHGYCGSGVGMEKLSGGLGKLKSFMINNPNEVITIVFESYVEPSEAAAVFIQTGLSEFAHTQPANAQWPKLKDMIKSGKRLVVFSSRAGDAAYPWYHAEWDYTWSSPYSFKKTSEFNCNLDRGSKNNAVFEVPHFITVGLPSTSKALEANSNPLFITRMNDCKEKSGRLPNIVSVDHYELGDLFDVVDELNGF